MTLSQLFALAWRGLVAAAAFMAVSAPASAQTFPGGKTIRIVVTTGTGTASDSAARYLASGMSKALNTAVIVDNRPGASGVLASDLVAKAAPDGHTLLLTFASHHINHWTMKPPYHAIDDFEPIARVNRSALVLTTAAASPCRRSSRCPT